MVDEVASAMSLASSELLSLAEVLAKTSLGVASVHSTRPAVAADLG